MPRLPKKSLKRPAPKSSLNKFYLFRKEGAKLPSKFYKDAADVRLFTFLQTYTMR